jgi:hypothetical protein
LPLWVRDAAEFEPEGDHIICRWCGSEWVMSFATAQLLSKRLGTALQDWRVEQSGKIATLADHRVHAASS